MSFRYIQAKYRTNTDKLFFFKVKCEIEENVLNQEEKDIAVHWLQKLFEDCDFEPRGLSSDWRGAQAYA